MIRAGSVASSIAFEGIDAWRGARPLREARGGVIMTPLRVS
jgi:hypothetical protein